MTTAFNPRNNYAIVIEDLAVPTGLTLTVDSDTAITLDWTDVATHGDVLIERSLEETSGFEEIATVALGDETYQDTGLDPSTEYFYRIRAFYLPQGYSAYSSTESATTDA